MGTKDTDALQRWEDHGAVWRAIHVSETKAIVDLCTCTGEPVDRLESDDPELIAFVRERSAAADTLGVVGE